LKQARSLVAAGWCKGTFATTREGYSVGHDDPDAVNFCAAGARLRACGNNQDLIDATYRDLTDSCLSTYGKTSICVNELDGKDAVLRCYDVAIERVTREMEGARMGTPEVDTDPAKIALKLKEQGLL
jgi:hypothetical protein